MKVEARERINLNENQVREIITAHLRDGFGFDARGMTFYWSQDTNRLSSVMVEGDIYELRPATQPSPPP